MQAHLLYFKGACGGAVSRNTAWVRFPMVSLEFFIDIIPSGHSIGPGVDSASNRNEYQEYFLWGGGEVGVKAAGT
jgi:hypothetical protein